uniref:Uncharacterized protein n=1 Tax=Anopheles atroparvus TaxID=41427 RepID=A0AAG5DQ30_ANOAO
RIGEEENALFLPTGLVRSGRGERPSICVNLLILLSNSRPPEECPETQRSANSPGFATADSRSPSPVQPLRRSSRVRRPPLWMEQYRQN